MRRANHSIRGWPRPAAARLARPAAIVKKRGVSDAEARQAHFVLLATGRFHASVQWPLDAKVSLRAFGAHWLMFDGHGRLAWLRVDSGRFGGLSLH